MGDRTTIREDLKLSVEKLGLREWDILVVRYDRSKFPTEALDLEFHDHIQKAVMEVLPPGACFLLLPEHVEIQALDDDVLEAIGLERIKN